MSIINLIFFGHVELLILIHFHKVRNLRSKSSRGLA